MDPGKGSPGGGDQASKLLYVPKLDEVKACMQAVEFGRANPDEVESVGIDSDGSVKLGSRVDQEGVDQHRRVDSDMPGEKPAVLDTMVEGRENTDAGAVQVVVEEAKKIPDVVMATLGEEKVVEKKGEELVAKVTELDGVKAEDEKEQCMKDVAVVVTEDVRDDPLLTEDTVEMVEKEGEAGHAKGPESEESKTDVVKEPLVKNVEVVVAAEDVREDSLVTESLPEVKDRTAQESLELCDEVKSEDLMNEPAGNVPQDQADEAVGNEAEIKISESEPTPADASQDLSHFTPVSEVFKTELPLDETVPSHQKGKELSSAQPLEIEEKHVPEVTEAGKLDLPEPAKDSIQTGGLESVAQNPVASPKDVAQPVETVAVEVEASSPNEQSDPPAGLVEDHNEATCLAQSDTAALMLKDKLSPAEPTSAIDTSATAAAIADPMPAMTTEQVIDIMLGKTSSEGLSPQTGAEQIHESLVKPKVTEPVADVILPKEMEAAFSFEGSCEPRDTATAAESVGAESKEISKATADIVSVEESSCATAAEAIQQVSSSESPALGDATPATDDSSTVLPSLKSTDSTATDTTCSVPEVTTSNCPAAAAKISAHSAIPLKHEAKVDTTTEPSITCASDDPAFATMNTAATDTLKEVFKIIDSDAESGAKIADESPKPVTNPDQSLKEEGKPEAAAEAEKSKPKASFIVPLKEDLKTTNLTLRSMADMWKIVPKGYKTAPAPEVVSKVRSKRERPAAPPKEDETVKLQDSSGPSDAGSAQASEALRHKRKRREVDSSGSTASVGSSGSGENSADEKESKQTSSEAAPATLPTLKEEVNLEKSGDVEPKSPDGGWEICKELAADVAEKKQAESSSVECPEDGNKKQKKKSVKNKRIARCERENARPVPIIEGDLERAQSDRVSSAEPQDSSKLLYETFMPSSLMQKPVVLPLFGAANENLPGSSQGFCMPQFDQIKENNFFFADSSGSGKKVEEIGAMAGSEGGGLVKQSDSHQGPNINTRGRGGARGRGDRQQQHLKPIQDRYDSANRRDGSRCSGNSRGSEAGHSAPPHRAKSEAIVQWRFYICQREHCKNEWFVKTTLERTKCLECSEEFKKDMLTWPYRPLEIRDAPKYAFSRGFFKCPQCNVEWNTKEHMVRQPAYCPSKCPVDVYPYREVLLTPRRRPWHGREERIREK